jgi:hypothetical protein
VLLKGAAAHYRARVICVPTSRPAWALTLVSEDDDRPIFFVEYAVLEGRPGSSIKDSDVKTVRAALDREIAESVQDVWLRMLRRVKYSERLMGGGADGVTYHFSRFVPLPQVDRKVSSGWQSGCIWTPEPSSMTGQLAGLGEALKEYAVASSEERLKRREDIRARVRHLMDMLDHVYPK